MTTAEISARRLKADRLTAAWLKLASPGSDVDGDPAEALALASAAGPADWKRAEALAGTRPVSDETQAVVLNDLYRLAHPTAVEDLFAGF
jgi:hypothetical protein